LFTMVLVEDFNKNLEYSTALRLGSNDSEIEL